MFDALRNGTIRAAAAALLLGLLLGFSPMTGRALASGTEGAPPKDAICVVSFGSTFDQGRQAIDGVVSAVKAAFPDKEVRLAFTSRIIRTRLAQKGQIVDEPLVALAKLRAEGYTRVAVVSTHVIPGEEYGQLADLVRALGDLGRAGSKWGFERIALSKPLLYNPEQDYARLAAILNRAYGKRLADGAVVLMGHGTPNPADSAYGLMQVVAERTNPRLLVGTVEGNPSFEDAKARLDKLGLRRVTLVPLMLVAGDHAHNDMAGSEEDSWKSRLEKAGYRVETVISGLGENPEIRAAYVERARAAAKEAFE
jgi:sirohydrochlorin cobaltochelatase